ncbi:hypothetical protein SPMU_30000 [Sphingomonas mucosissima]|uniref:Glycerophosphoryl diester phosphodiesterase membrane domain-containing protein n=2 Tax=Sphingomonas mucosissima TaxID=370959 RepID=A0A245ZEG7_9SPHN|nr:hypothetical protein SPMU_30000 [Sphingomonas mucosissima]
MISMGLVWDRAMAVISGRLGILLSLAVILLILPPVAQAGLEAISDTSFALRSTKFAASLLVFIAATISAIAMTAVASDPAVDQGAALAIGRRRLGPFIGVSLLIGLLFAVAMIPGAVLIGLAGFDVAQARAGGVPDGVNMPLLGAGLLYFIVLMPVMLWAAARLLPLSAVIVNERRGAGAIRRSFALTRGSSLKLMGVLILYGLVFLVVLMAATSVVGVVARLLAGADSPVIVSLVIAAVTAVVTALFSILQMVFAAQLYLAAREAHDAA